jgi:hypothetical protein
VRPPRRILTAAHTLLAWQALSLLLLPATLAFEEAAAPPAAATAAAEHCTLDRKCTTVPAPPVDDDPCRLVCVADAGALSWLGIVGVVAEPEKVRGREPSVTLTPDAPVQIVQLVLAPVLPPPRG